MVKTHAHGKGPSEDCYAEPAHERPEDFVLGLGFIFASRPSN